MRNETGLWAADKSLRAQGWGQDPEDEESRNGREQQADLGGDAWSGGTPQVTANRTGVPGHMAHRRSMLTWCSGFLGISL